MLKIPPVRKQLISYKIKYIMHAEMSPINYKK